ncbi:MAG: group 1 truncated hemoglobin [Gammaproteobacteria bacterium]|nr:MAG: group 1 truncated hemoglobin [Gammaproteobacteria bacterium]PCJ13141.1 MAG: group 1 truncated hemoglobin [Gammaproteobacteria bacterium]
MSSIYESLGGEPAVNAAVDIFYKKVLADDRVKHFFDEMDMDRQRNMQKSFLTFALGGPNNYKGKNMRKAHEKLVTEKGLNETHFDAVLESLGATLQELDVPENLIAEAAALVVTLKPDILNQ